MFEFGFDRWNEIGFLGWRLGWWRFERWEEVYEVGDWVVRMDEGFVVGVDLVGLERK